MIETFNYDRMAAMFSRRLGLAASPGLYARNDANGASAVLRDAIELWYTQILRQAPLDMVPVERLPLEEIRREGARHISFELPRQAERLVCVVSRKHFMPLYDFMDARDSMASWLGHGRITRYLDFPVGTFCGRNYDVYGMEPDDVDHIKCVCRAPEGFYAFDPVLLNLMDPAKMPDIAKPVKKWKKT